MLTFMTPDFGHSDFWHFNFAIRFFMSDALKHGYLPLWSKNMGTGFPLFAETQIGLFNIYNFLAFKFLSPAIALDLGYVLTFITAFSGTFLFCKSINLSRKTALFAGFLFSLCGIFVTHVPHYNYIQAASFLPWIFFLTEKIITTKKIRFGLLLIIFLSQQIYSGYPQVPLITLVGCTLYSLFRAYQQKSFKSLIIWGIFICLGVVISFPQLALTWQLVQNSPPLFSNTYADFPYNPIHLLSFLNPYLFGDPRIGTYPPISADWGIFWESTAYFGLLPVIFVLYFILFTKKTIFQKTFLIIAGISLILLLGKYTPFSFINNLPPFSAFRVPARYILLFAWSLVIIFAIGFNNLKNKWLANGIIVLTIIDVLFFALNYNPIVDSARWLERPEMVKYLESHDHAWFRVHAIPAIIPWNKIFLTEGWKNINKYQNFRNSLDGNENLYWSVPSFDFYTRLVPRRVILQKIMVEKETRISDSGNVSITPEAIKILSLAGVKYITSPSKLSNLKLIFETHNRPKFYLYKILKPYPHAYLTNNFIVVDPHSFKREYMVKNPSNQSVVLESKIRVNKDDHSIRQVKILEDSDLVVSVQASSPKDAILILSDSYYPGWKAYIDHIETKIYPANINQRAVLFPEGRHLVTFKYEPFAF